MPDILVGVDQKDSFAASLWPRSSPTSAVACFLLVLLWMQFAPCPFRCRQVRRQVRFFPLVADRHCSLASRQSGGIGLLVTLQRAVFSLSVGRPRFPAWSIWTRRTGYAVKWSPTVSAVRLYRSHRYLNFRAHLSVLD